MRPTCFPASHTRVKKSGLNWREAKKPMRFQKPANCFLPCPLADGSLPLMRYTPIVSVFHLLRSKHAYPLFVIKGNEPTLQVDLATYFADPYAQFQQAETVDRRRGRVERRTILVSSEMGSYRRSLLAWGHSCRPTDALSHRKGPDHRRSRLPHRHPPTWLGWATISVDPQSRTLGNRKQFTLRA